MQYEKCNDHIAMLCIPNASIEEFTLWKVECKLPFLSLNRSKVAFVHTRTSGDDDFREDVILTWEGERGRDGSNNTFSVYIAR